MVILFNDGAGSFTEVVADSGGRYVFGAFAADVTGDGIADAILSGDYATVIPGLGARTFGPGSDALLDNDVRGMGLADLDGDGVLDVVAGTRPNSYSIQLLKMTNGVLGVARQWAVPHQTNGVVPMDYDNNGTTDILVPGYSRSAILRSTIPVIEAGHRHKHACDFGSLHRRAVRHGGPSRDLLASPVRASALSPHSPIP
jgi:hypothetical protein